jgi:hypothetical protein
MLYVYVYVCVRVYTQRGRESSLALSFSLSLARALSHSLVKTLWVRRGFNFICCHLNASFYECCVCVCVYVCLCHTHTHVHTHGHIRRGMQACVVRIKKQMTGGMLSTSAKCTPVFWVGSLKRFLVIALRCRQLEHA